jgi:hypothetical protein
MPFENRLTKIYESIVLPAVKSKKLRCERADDFTTNNAVLKDIIEGICRARFLIADVTKYNPNVMYELGIAHAIGKEVIMIYNRRSVGSKSRFPFDISHIRTIKYENTAPGGKN